MECLAGWKQNEKLFWPWGMKFQIRTGCLGIRQTYGIKFPFFFYKIRYSHHLKLFDDFEGSSVHGLVSTPIEHGPSFYRIVWENEPNIATN